jgi:hypothetical protein
VILATGWGASIDQETARGRGIVAVLAKPYRQIDLEQILTRIPERADQSPSDDGQNPTRARAS